MSAKKQSCGQWISSAIIGGLEDGFSRLGLAIGTYPFRFMIGCVIAAGLTGIGLLAFKEVTDPDKLWVAEDAQVVADKAWVETYYPSRVIREQIIATSGNILTPTGVSALLDLYNKVAAAELSNGTTLSDVCLSAGPNCMVYSILEIWRYNSTEISALTQDDIINDVNTVTTSPLYRNPIDISNYLGATTTNSSGAIISAQAASMTWLTNGSDTAKDLTKDWEELFINIGKAGHPDLSKTFVIAGRSWYDESGDAIKGDVPLLGIGYFLVIIFVFLVLGKLNLMEQRAWLSLGGFICVGLSILVSFGLSSAFQQAYGSLQSVLPFLLLGIGVDDMFVIMSAYNNLKPDEMELEIPQKISRVLKHAGVSITVTSFTDFMAFMIGATTIIPALKSFCIYAGIGVISLYLLQAIFFTACLTIDLRRFEGDRDGCCCCIKHPAPYKPSECSQKQLVPYFFKHGLARIIIQLPFQIFAAIVALALFGVNVYGVVKLEQYFDPFWFLPSNSYASEYYEAARTYFPSDGAVGYVYCGNIDYWSRRTDIEAMDTAMANSEWINNGTTDSWFAVLTGWLSKTTDPTVKALLDANKYPVNETAFVSLTFKMKNEIFRRTGSYLMFSNTGSELIASRFPFRHISMSDASQEIRAMDNTRALVKNAGFSGSECFPYSRFYLNWETNKIIQEELYRNLALALACVFVVTFILIANIRTSLLVFCGVLFTLVDVAGTMYFWGLTIDTVTSVILVLAIGLAVDYSAHIGHMFMTIKGDKTARLQGTIGEIGPPVFYGGFSTFLAFVLLGNSNSYVFKTFFKVNFLVVLYGLFNGLVFVPILLRWIGPEPYDNADHEFRHHHPNPQDGERSVQTPLQSKC